LAMSNNKSFVSNGTLTVADNNTLAYGAYPPGSTTEIVRIMSGVTGVNLDPNFERIELGGALNGYKFLVSRVEGLQIFASDGTTLIATIPNINQDVKIAFTDGSAILQQSGTMSFALNSSSLSIDQPATPILTGSNALLTSPGEISSLSSYSNNPNSLVDTAEHLTSKLNDGLINPSTNVTVTTDATIAQLEDIDYANTNGTLTYAGIRDNAENLIKNTSSYVKGAHTVNIIGDVTVAQVNTIDGLTTGVVTATLSDSVVNLKTLSNSKINAYTITVTDSSGSSINPADLIAIAAKTSGIMSVASAVTIAGTMAQVTDVVVVNEISTPKATLKITSPISVDQANIINGLTTGIVIASISDTAENLANLNHVSTDPINNYMITVTNDSDQSIDASVLSAIAAKTSGVVTVSEALTINGTISQINDALISKAIQASVADVNISDTETISVDQANAIDHLTTGVVTAKLSGNATELAKLSELSDSQTNAYTITLTGTGPNATTLSATDISAITAKTSEVMTIASGLSITGTTSEIKTALINLHAKAANVTITDSLGGNSLLAIDLSAIAAQTGSVTVDNAVTITGTTSEIKTALTLGNLHATTANVTITDLANSNSILATDLIAIAAKTSGS
ncbi:MAG: hypothetical protein WCL22_05735, partial [bacterium]